MSLDDEGHFLFLINKEVVRLKGGIFGGIVLFFIVKICGLWKS